MGMLPSVRPILWPILALLTSTGLSLDVLLPTHLVPEYYKLDLVPFLEPDNFTIRGHVEIWTRCRAPGRNVTLHAFDIDVRSVAINCINNKEITSVQNVRMDVDRQMMVAELSDELLMGASYIVKIDFVARLNDKLTGFYRNAYQNELGETMYMAVTQFEPTFARSAFPCFDEPALKARFEVSLGRRPHMSTISNMPVKRDGLGLAMEGTDEYVWDHYDISVPMSTYLVAFVVSDFAYKEAEPTGNDVDFRVWARKTAIDQVDYAAEIGPRILKYFEDFFHVEYPLPKMDMIAVPDFSAGAMENWGLVTYRESALLFKPGVSTQYNKESIASIISHELAHQWFGNLVTPRWWTDLWLNEGFASYVEYIGVESVHPEWRFLHRNMINELHTAMELDMLDHSHPISIPVKHPDEISEIFDTISYLKGASIIRMMDHFLGRTTLRHGLSSYLQSLRYKAATQDDLWHHLSKVAIQDGSLPKTLSVKEIMDTWTLQSGYPVVTVIRDYEHNTARLSQARFRLSSMTRPEGAASAWWIPITFSQPGEDSFKKTDHPIWMSPAEGAKVISDLPDEESAVVFNTQETGFYRVNYDAKNWQLIGDQLRRNHTMIHVINRAQILDDVFNLARAGVVDYPLALGFTRYLDREMDYVAWRPANKGLSFIGKMFKRTPGYGEYLRYMRNIVKPLYYKIGHQVGRNAFTDDLYLQRTIVSLACTLRLPECCEKVKEGFQHWMTADNPDLKESNPFPVELKRTSYCSGVREGGEEEWNFIFSRYTKSNVATERSQLLRALSCTREIWLLNKLLHLSVTPGSGVRKQDVTSIFSMVASNIYGRDLAFDFVRDKWTFIKEFVGPKGIGRLVKGNVLAGRNTRLELRELRQFYDDYLTELGGAVRSVQQAIEKAERNIEWMDAHYEDILDWLGQHNEVMEKQHAAERLPRLDFYMENVNEDEAGGDEDDFEFHAVEVEGDDDDVDSHGHTHVTIPHRNLHFTALLPKDSLDLEKLTS